LEKEKEELYKALPDAIDYDPEYQGSVSFGL
jgi:hypothetical protein